MQKRVVEPQADETRSETEKVGVETRLTAEQFWLTWARSDIRAEITDAAIAFAEAFRDKSEAERSPFAAHNWQHWNEMCKTAQEQARAVLEQNAGLREDIDKLKHVIEQQDLALGRGFWDGLKNTKDEKGLREEIERLKRLAGTPTVNLWKQLKDEQAYSLKVTREAAALRERERWIPVEEKLPNPNAQVRVYRSTLPKRDLEFYDGRTLWSDGEEDTNVTHWKALSAAPERS